MIAVCVEGDVVDVESLGSVHVRDGNGDELEPHVHTPQRKSRFYGGPVEVGPAEVGISGVVHAPFLVQQLGQTGASLGECTEFCTGRWAGGSVTRAIG